jgi:hypothetical protein
VPSPWSRPTEGARASDTQDLQLCSCDPCRERRHADHLRFVIALYEERISAMKRELEGLAR